MSYRIMLLLKPYIRQYCEKILGASQEDVEFTYREYNEFSELFSIFQQEKTHYDGFITSGYIPLIAERRFIGAGEEIPTACFNIEVEHIYQLMLKMTLLKEKSNVNRVGIDFLEDGSAHCWISIRGRFCCGLFHWCSDLPSIYEYRYCSLLSVSSTCFAALSRKS